MSDFLKKLIADMGDEDEGLGDLDLSAAFEAGQAAYKEAMGVVLKHTTPFMSKGQLIEGSVVVFTAVWLLVRWMEEGVRKSDEAGSGTNPVRTIFELTEAVLRAPDEASALLAMAKYSQGKTNGK